MKKAFTLVEMLVVIAIIGILILLFLPLISTPVKTGASTEREFTMQTNMRAQLEEINDRIRTSSSIVYMDKKPYPSDNFMDTVPDGYLKKNWNYLIAEKDGKGKSRIVYYRWEKDKHIVKVLDADDDKTDYNIEFVTPDEKRVAYKITANDKEKEKREKVIETDIISQNSYEARDESRKRGDVKHRDGSLISVSNALAFRYGTMDISQEEIKDISTPIVGIVLDMSASMMFKMNGSKGSDNIISYRSGRVSLKYNGRNYELTDTNWNRNGFPSSLNGANLKLWNIDASNISNGKLSLQSDTRMEILRPKLVKFLDQLTSYVKKSGSNAFVSLNTFHCKSERDGAEVKELDEAGLGALKEDVKYLTTNPSGRISGDRASGGTNLGDGIRRTYYLLKHFSDSPEGKSIPKKTYSLLLMMDGAPSYYSTSGGSYHFGDGESEKLVQQNEGLMPLEYAIKASEKLIKKFPDGEINAYVIGFSSVSVEKKRCEAVAKALGAKEVKDGRHYYDVSNSDELDAAFGDIVIKAIDPSGLWKASTPF